MDVFKSRNILYFNNLSDQEIIKIYWDMLCKEILSQNLNLGVFAEEPNTDFKDVKGLTT